MTGNIKVEGYDAFKCHSAEWSRNVDNYTDSAKFVIPALCKLKYPDNNYSDVVATGLQFTEGKKVEMYFGYNGNNVTRFKGFIKRINFSVPLEVECEGYSYQLRHKIVNASYKNVKMKAILNDLVKDTDITLSNKIPDVTIDKVQFSNASGVQVLEWFKDKMFQTVYFNFSELYVGLRAGETKATVKHRLKWNVIKDDELLFNADKEGAQVFITLATRDKTGVFKKTHDKAINEKVLRLFGIDAHNAYAKQVMNDVQLQHNYMGYTGKIKAFAEPYAEPGMATEITDAKYSERNGKYLIDSVEGTFNPSGGRQVIGIGYKL